MTNEQDQPGWCPVCAKHVLLKQKHFREEHGVEQDDSE